MPPKRKAKSTKDVKDNAERREKILSTKENILKIKRMVLQIIESMLEKKVSSKWFIRNITKLCHADYDDVVQERNIGNLCGYPLCCNDLKQIMKQKYRISQVTNKVYDVTERKCFCSNQCYKASNYLKTQLSPIPLYMRKEEVIKIQLLPDCSNSGSAGEEIVFHHTISQDEIYKVYHEETSSTILQNLLDNQIKKCAESLGGLQIKEHVYEKPYVFGDETSKTPDDSGHNDKSESDSDTADDSDHSDDEKLFPSYDNLSVLSHRHMPIPEKIKKSVLIPPFQSERSTNSPVESLSLDFVFNVFKDWMTEDTLKYLMGEKCVYGFKADHLFRKMTESDPSNSEKMASIKNEYIQLCLKIDSLPDDDDIGDLRELDIRNESNPKNVSQAENKPVKTVFKRRPRKSKEISKHVTFAPESQKVLQAENIVELAGEKNIEQPSRENADSRIEQSFKESAKSLPKEQTEHLNSDKKNISLNEEESSQTEHPLPEPTFPLVDSVSQNILRRQVLTGKLKAVYTDLLPVAGLHYTDIREAVRKFVESLSLTPTNISFKPSEWKIISLVLFRMLTRTVLKDIHDEVQFAKLCEDPFIPITIDLRTIEKLVCDIVSAENIISLH